MNFNDLLTLLMLVVPPTLVFLTAYFMLKQQSRKELELKMLDLKLRDNKDMKILRLQAYERLALFLERVSPYSLISRCIEPEMISQELQYAIVKTIRAEFEHNLSQQVYVSDNAWNLIVQSKDEIIKTINLISAQVAGDASAHELSRYILQAIGNANMPLPTQQALDYLKAEGRELF